MKKYKVIVHLEDVVEAKDEMEAIDLFMTKFGHNKIGIMNTDVKEVDKDEN